jgi:DNA-directed RNA polymerase specialized sigma24 family protein
VAEQLELEDHVLRTDLTDHRGTDDARLVRAVADGDAIALAEAYHRTVTAAHACARRMLASPVEIEALLRAVYSELWEDPPVDRALEGWIRDRCFTLGTGYLRQRGLSAHSPSLAAWTSGLEADPHAGGSDALERMIAELTDQQQAALVRAHDQGIRTADQEDPQAGPALQHALLVLASPLTDDERHAAEMCSSGVALANWMFGLLPPHEAAAVPGTAAEPTPCGRLASVLRRARRRFEPLPPTPDLGHRVLASVLGGGPRESREMRASRLDSDLRIASADLNRGAGGGAPRSSLDMAVPAPSDGDEQQLTALRDRNGTPRGWEVADDVGDDRDEPTPLRAPSGPPALAGSSAPPMAFGNAAPALAPATPDPDEASEDDLVRMPLRRPQSDADGPPQALRGRDHGAGADTESIQAMPDTAADEDAPPPPRALRPGTGAAEGDRRQDDQQADAPARSPFGDTGPAFSPVREEDRSGQGDRDLADTESPLRRPARDDQPALPPSALSAPLRDDTATQWPPSVTDEDEGDDAGPRFEARAYQRQPDSGGDPDATTPTPIQRDDSDPRLEDMFGADPDATAPPSGPSSRSGGGGGGATPGASGSTVAALRRPVAGSTQAPERPAQRTQPAAAAGPTVSPVEDETSGGSSLLRWLVVLLLVAAGAAVGIFLGQMLI